MAIWTICFMKRWNENFRSIERFHAEKKPAISDSSDFVCSLARGEHCPMELVGNRVGTGKIIRLGNFQYSTLIIIKDEYGFSPVIGIKVILNFIRSILIYLFFSFFKLALI